MQNKKRNKRYQGNDAAIIETILQHRRHITVRQLARQLEISRSVFYNHYKSIHHAMSDFEDSILQEFANQIAAISPSASIKENERLFRELFLFMAHRKDETFYHICINIDNHGTLFRLMSILYPKLYIDWGDDTPVAANEAVHIFHSIAVVFISNWGSAEHCDIHRMWRYIRNLQKLTQHARKICIEPIS